MPCCACHDDDHDDASDEALATLSHRVDDAKSTLREHPVFAEVLAAVRAAEPPTTIVSLGVGRFAVSRAARYQLALALLLRDELLSADESEPLHAFDPAWSALELRYMRERAGRCAVRPHNEAGRIALPGEGRCLFLVQHCPRALYSNLLEAHWGPEGLSRLIVLGNSFAALADNATGGGSGAGIEAWCRVTRAASLVTEVSISSGRGELDHAFGGTSLHTFDATRMPPKEDGLWTRPFAQAPEPSKEGLLADDFLSID